MGNSALGVFESLGQETLLKKAVKGCYSENDRISCS
jgi:hypothetical protein